MIFTVALTLCMVMAGLDVVAGRKTVGDFVLVNALLLQLFIPLNFMGMVYREIKQSLTDIERMMDVLEPEAGGGGPARRASHWSSRAAPSASRTCASTTTPSG